MGQITIHDVEDTLSRVPFVKPPKHVYIFEGTRHPEQMPKGMYDLVYDTDSGEITSEKFFDMDRFHELDLFHYHMVKGNVDQKQSKQPQWIVRGMTPFHVSEAIYTADATPDTIIHEPLHGMGVKRETVIRPMAHMFLQRSKLNLGLRRQRVQYREIQWTQQQKLDYLKSRQIVPSSGSLNIRKYELVG